MGGEGNGKIENPTQLRTLMRISATVLLLPTMFYVEIGAGYQQF